jgi:hypothetical protein
MSDQYNARVASIRKNVSNRKPTGSTRYRFVAGSKKLFDFTCVACKQTLDNPDEIPKGYLKDQCKTSGLMCYDCFRKVYDVPANVRSEDCIYVDGRRLLHWVYGAESVAMADRAQLKCIC